MKNYHEVLVSLRRIIRATDLHSKKLSKTSGLTAPQLLILQTVRSQGEAMISAVASAVNLSQATVTTILDRLEKRALIRRERSQYDKRRVYVSLTPEGLDLIKESPVPLQAHFIERFQALQAWEQSMIIAALQRVAGMMDADHLDASPVLDIGALDRVDGDAAVS